MGRRHRVGTFTKTKQTIRKGARFDMADIADVADAQGEILLSAGEKAIRADAAKIPVGEPGDCDLCGEYFTRTVNGHCGRCRDKYGMP